MSAIINHQRPSSLKLGHFVEPTVWIIINNYLKILYISVTPYYVAWQMSKLVDKYHRHWWFKITAALVLGTWFVVLRTEPKNFSCVRVTTKSAIEPVSVDWKKTELFRVPLYNFEIGLGKILHWLVFIWNNFDGHIKCVYAEIFSLDFWFTFKLKVISNFVA